MTVAKGKWSGVRDETSARSAIPVASIAMDIAVQHLQWNVMTQHRTIMEAIVTRRCIEATYNKMNVKLAPHILYTRHDELFLDAVTVEREGEPPRELKLGTFKLAGLAVRELTPIAFDKSEIFNADEEKYAGVTLIAVD